MARTEAQDVNIARNFALSLACPSHLMWVSYKDDFRLLKNTQRPLTGRQFIVAFNEGGSINEVIYDTPNRGRFQSLTGLQVSPDFAGHASVPYMFDVRIGEDNVGVEFHKGLPIRELKSGADGKLLDGSKKSNFNLPKCLELVVADFSIPTLTA